MTSIGPGNVASVIADLDNIIDGFDFRRPGIEGSLGVDVAYAVIRGPAHGEPGGIMGRCAEGVTPDGSPWPPNSDDPAGKGYRSRKQEEYGWDETNRRTGQMLSQASLFGHTFVAPDEVTLVYGTGDAPRDSKAPTGHLSGRDAATTDIVKAQHAHAQGRGFYGLGAGDRENVTAVCREALERAIRDANGR